MLIITSCNYRSQEIFEYFDEVIAGTLKIEEFSIKEGKPEVHEKVIEIEPDMSKIGPTFKNALEFYKNNGYEIIEYYLNKKIN